MNAEESTPLTPDASSVRTVRLAPVVYGDGVPLDDPAESFHEASKIYPSFAGRQTRAYLLEADEEVRVSSARCVKRNPHLPAVALPEPRFPDVPFGEVVNGRRSERTFGSGDLSLEQLSALLHAAYGTTHQLLTEAPAGVGPLLRTVPSGGGLYPLEIDVFAWNVSSLEPGRYHFDPLRRVLEVLAVEGFAEAVRETTAYPAIATGCAALFVVSAMFWRTRFKYGLRGYRFALLEAGHVAQNLLLAATAFQLASVPLGGFFDRRLDELLSLDGVNESTLYAIAVGPRGGSTDEA